MTWLKEWGFYSHMFFTRWKSRRSFSLVRMPGVSSTWQGGSVCISTQHMIYSLWSSPCVQLIINRKCHKIQCELNWITCVVAKWRKWRGRWDHMCLFGHRTSLSFGPLSLCSTRPRVWTIHQRYNWPVVNVRIIMWQEGHLKEWSMTIIIVEL